MNTIIGNEVEKEEHEIAPEDFYVLDDEPWTESRGRKPKDNRTGIFELDPGKHLKLPGEGNGRHKRIAICRLARAHGIKIKTKYNAEDNTIDIYRK